MGQGVIYDRRPGIPPEGLRFMGEDPRTFRIAGDQLFESFRRLARIEPGDAILDIGSGYGRLAHAILRWGEFTGRYVGIDILPNHIAWSQDNLGRPGIEFRHIDVFNDRYNPGGKKTTADVRVEGGPFDKVIMSSVCTHLWPDDVTAYLALTAESLRLGGLAHISFFVLDTEARRNNDEGLIDEAWAVPHAPMPMIRVKSLEDPLHVIAYDLDWIRDTAARFGLHIVDTDFGCWSARNGRVQLQDVLVFERREVADLDAAIAKARAEVVFRDASPATPPPTIAEASAPKPAPAAPRPAPVKAAKVPKPGRRHTGIKGVYEGVLQRGGPMADAAKRLRRLLP